MVDLVQIKKLAAEKEDENDRFRTYLKSYPEDIDPLVNEITKKVWAGIDCTTCANCCRSQTMHPVFSEEEVSRLANRLGMQRQELIDMYLERAGKEWRTRPTPCPFLKDNLCSIYEDRPAGCISYPGLYEPDFASRTLIMIEQTFTCPIVYEVMEKLKEELSFGEPRKEEV